MPEGASALPRQALVFVGPRALCEVLVKARGEAVPRIGSSCLGSDGNLQTDRERSYGPDDIKAMTAAYEAHW